MFNLKRNQVIITVLIFMIAVAAYLNTQQPEGNLSQTNVAMNSENEPEQIDFFDGYNEKIANQTQVAEEGAQLGENTNTQLTMADATQSEKISATITKKTEDQLNNEEVPASKNLEVDYFSEEKLLREQSRAQQIDQLTEYVSNDGLDQEAKAEAAANLIEIQERIEKESSAEALLKAKGFDEVYVRIDEETVDVVVNKAELTDSEIAQIEEIVNRKTGYSVSKINITPLNGVAKK